jgi:hypothetical protein
LGIGQGAASWPFGAFGKALIPNFSLNSLINSLDLGGGAESNENLEHLVKHEFLIVAILVDLGGGAESNENRL